MCTCNLYMHGKSRAQRASTEETCNYACICNFAVMIICLAITWK